ncbi:MAG: polysaccharide biosynthesis/export family protein [Candidatus Krumholzibacteriia bacterium]
MAWAGILLLAALAGCGGARPYVARNEMVAFSPEQKADIEANAVRSYRIQEGDILKISFAYERELNQENVLVLGDGLVSLTGIDPIRLAGLTVTEADSALTEAYSHEYREPALSVMIEKTPGRRVFVLGEVRDPGAYAIPQGGIDIMSAISMASGFSEDAARDGTLIVRVTPQGYQIQEVNLKTLGTAQFVSLATLPLLPFDIVYVPRTRVGDFAYFTRAVLAGLGSITRIVYDAYSIAKGLPGRY